MEVWCKIEKKRTKFILAFISAIMFQFGSAMVLSSGNFAVYFVSYIHYKDSFVSLQYGNIMSPIIYLFLSAFSPLAGVIVKKLGPRLTFLLSSVIVEICLVGFYFQRNLWIFYTLSLIVGLGNGFSCGAPLNNACRFYPKRKGLIGAIILAFGGLSNSLYSYVGELIVNPDKEEIKNRKVNPYYSEEVSKRSKYFFILALCVVPVTTALTQLFYYQYDVSCEENENKEINNTENAKPKPVLVPNSTETNAKEILADFRFWKNMIIVCVMPFWIYFLSSTYRAYVSMIGLDKTLISFISPLVAFITAVFGIIWALVIDKFGYKPTVKIIAVICIICSFYFIFKESLKNVTMYYVGLLVSTTVARNAIIAVINPHLMQIYEMRNFLFIGGYSRLFNQLAGFIAGMVSIFISLDHKTADQLQGPYQIVAIVGLVLSVIGFVFTFFEGDEKFVFKKQMTENLEDNKIEVKNENTPRENIVPEQVVVSTKERSQ